MAVTPGTLGRRYLPFIALAAVQVLLVAVAPSRPGNKVSSFASGRSFAGGTTGADNGAGGPGAGDSGAAVQGGTAVDASGNPIGGGTAGGRVSGGRGVAGGGSAGLAGSAAAGGAGGVGGPAAPGATAAAGDRSHCDKDGKQIGFTYYMPQCQPVFHGDNGGSTMTGVDRDHINFVFYNALSNAQVDAVLKLQDLAATPEEHCEAFESFTIASNKRFELYGRKLVSLDGPGNNKGSAKQSPCHFPYFQGECSLTPPDPKCERAEADLIARSLKPAFVLAPVADPALYDELAKNHIVVLGGGGTTSPPPTSYFTDSAPYYYDVFMDGGRAMRHLAEYYCKKLDAKPVRYAGSDVLHPDGNPLGKIPVRKLAITYPATNGDPTGAISANQFIKLVSGGV
ncbi:MAG: hypothetical protein ACYDAD_13325, partial [Acidimicrobiales bacterium]